MIDTTSTLAVATFCVLELLIVGRGSTTFLFAVLSNILSLQSKVDAEIAEKMISLFKILFENYLLKQFSDLLSA